MHFISIFHGRTDENAVMDNWGLQGPIIGPVNVGMVYGRIRLVDARGLLFFLPMMGDLIKIQDRAEGRKTYYGDMAVLSAEDDKDILREAQLKDKLFTLEQFSELYYLK